MATIRKTEYGSPLAESWSPEWCAKVAQRERDNERRICGARTYDGEPCELLPFGKNGRCKSHGGAPGSGAQPGNFNARLHGLYVHRLQTCGDHCPFWERCPHADYQIMRLPMVKRPVCPIEREEFDLLSRRYTSADGHAQQNLALLGTMVGRATRALSVEALYGNGADSTRGLKTFLRVLRAYENYHHTLRPELSDDPGWQGPMFPDEKMDSPRSREEYEDASA